ncbi:MAG: aminopeptidase P family protein [Candidatus Bathyarchaeota archaeon]|nr:MAG: aminopeptidase P family protein [Candidatus Bathyarchaeota archaeon]
MINRIRALKKSFNKELDGYVIINQPNTLTNQAHMLYLADFSGGTALLVPKEGESTLYVYGVNYEAAKAEARNCTPELIKRGKDVVKMLADQVKHLKLKKLGYDLMAIQSYEKIAKSIGNATKLVAKSDLIWNLRRVKDEYELKLIRTAGQLTTEGMRAACNNIKTGYLEFEVAAEIEYEMRKRGSDGLAFETQVASGPRSAYPHGGCGERKLKNGDLVVVDIGAIFKNYRADMSRTFVVGKPSAKQQKIFAIVNKAEEEAFQKITDGSKASEVDATARNIIKRAGYGEHFVHGLGHGVGLETHEQPVLNPTSKDSLRVGNVVTDEPGIYLIGFGGFRVEDTVLVCRNRSERLTSGFDSLNVQ